MARQRRSADERNEDRIDREIATSTRQPAPVKRNWTARVRTTVLKSVRLENCTEDEARTNPWEHAVHEQETDQVDWEVEKLEQTE